MELADPDRYDDRYKRWRIEDLPILPEPFKLVTRRGGGDQLKAIKGQLRRPEITRVINACAGAWLLPPARFGSPSGGRSRSCRRWVVGGADGPLLWGLELGEEV